MLASEQPQYYRVERGLSPDSVDDIGLLINRIIIKGIAADDYFRARDPANLHVSSLNADEFGFMVRESDEHNPIQKIPSPAWRTALETGMGKLPGYDKPLEHVLVETVRLFGTRSDRVGLVLRHPQLDKERNHQLKLMRRLGGVVLAPGIIHVAFGTFTENADNEFIRLAQTFTPRYIDLERAEIHSESSPKIDARLDRNPPYSARLAVA